MAEGRIIVLDGIEIKGLDLGHNTSTLFLA
jgi:hypothetical protein